ncbi:hypothetical protein QTG54_007495 [Skeletonema marinoi]|uniref:RRM domain-containing protein n=1 Tax=Skeletonema marinoi TaxID=267567 RepID=A0AAD8YAH7_9STRA|nr:hypothetical protein QTG54_007495 [Skeletonema marinoi]
MRYSDLLQLRVGLVFTHTTHIETMEFTLRNCAEQSSSKSTEETNNNLPPLLHLQLPVSLLSNLSSQSRLLVSREELGQQANDDNPSLKIKVAAGDGTNRKQTKDDEIYTLQTETGNSIHREWYQSTTKTNLPVTKKELQKIGTTNKCYKLIVDLKKIGEKTRRLYKLEQENKKRKEIVRLDGDEVILPPIKRGRVSEKPSQPKKQQVGQKKTAKPPTRKRRRTVDPTVDGWFPDTDDLNRRAVSKDDHSNIVRLHGLPVGVKPEHIRKFFQGLDPSLIFVLPSNKTALDGWDVQYDSYNLASAGRIKIDRCSNVFRVFVKFQSALVADAAIERSGEWIGLDKESAAIRQDGMKGAAISVSPVPKRVASYLQKNMAINCKVGVSIAETKIGIEQQLGNVIHMAWIMASKKLKIEYIITKKDLTILGKAHAFPTNSSEYKSSVTRYNSLIDLHEKIEMNLGHSMTHTFDPSCMQDPAHRITQSVSNWILDEIDIIGKLLKESRHANNFWSKSKVSDNAGMVV